MFGMPKRLRRRAILPVREREDCTTNVKVIDPCQLGKDQRGRAGIDAKVAQRADEEATGVF
jgi:hypothetical protein